MALVNPQIAMSYRPAVEYQPRNALAEYAQIQSIVGGQRQAEVADMQLRRMQQEDAEIERIHQIAMRQGGPDNRLEMGRALFASRNPQQRELGYKILQHEEAKTAFANAEQRFGYAPAKETTAPAAAAAAPATAMTAPAPQGELVAAPIRPIPSPVTAPAAADAPAPAGETDLAYLQRQFGTPGGAAAGPNALAPAAPVTNAMLAPSTAPVTGARVAPAAAPATALTGLGGKTLAQLQQEQRTYSLLEQQGAPGAKGRLEEIKREIDFIYKTSEPGADQKLMRDLNIPLTEAGFTKFQRLKDSPSELTKLLDGLNLSPAQRREFELRMAQKLVSHPAGTQVILPPQEKAFESELGKGQAERILKSQAGARDAVGIIDTVNTGRQIMQSGMITGAGAEFLVNLNQALKTVGIDAGYADASANSQAFAANMAGNVGRIIKQFGAGTGLSNADREYAEKMAGGKITLDASAIRRILDINERAARNVIKLHNKDVSGIKTNIPLTVEEPPATRAAASTTAPPPAAVEYLRANPAMRGAFDAKYGAGAADRALKGQ